MRFPPFCVVFLILLLSATLPASAVITYSSDAIPAMAAEITGTNEFSPGQDAMINVMVRNNALFTTKTYNTTGTIERDDLPTTAKTVSVGLLASGAPVVIRSNPRLIGDLEAQGVVTVPVQVKILRNATTGEYQVPLAVSYSFLSSTDWLASDTLMSKYQDVTDIVPLTIRIKPMVTIDVVQAAPENLNVGTEGYLNMLVKNTGIEDGKKATVKIIRNGASPIIPTDSSVYIGDFPRDGVVYCRYRVATTTDASNQTYPVNAAVTYENREGDTITSASDTFGIPVGPKILFAVSSDPLVIGQGSSSVVKVTYTNVGSTTAFKAQSRLSAVSPFTSSDEMAYLGDLLPGGSATAQYRISAAGNAGINNYTLDTEVRYRDALDNSMVSDMLRVPVQVVPSQGGPGPLGFLAGFVVLLVLGGGVYYWFRIRKQ